MLTSRASPPKLDAGKVVLTISPCAWRESTETKNIVKNKCFISPYFDYNSKSTLFSGASQPHPRFDFMVLKCCGERRPLAPPNKALCQLRSFVFILAILRQKRLDGGRNDKVHLFCPVFSNP